MKIWSKYVEMVFYNQYQLISQDIYQAPSEQYLQLANGWSISDRCVMTTHVVYSDVDRMDTVLY